MFFKIDPRNVNLQNGSNLNGLFIPGTEMFQWCTIFHWFSEGNFVRERDPNYIHANISEYIRANPLYQSYVPTNRMREVLCIYNYYYIYLTCKFEWRLWERNLGCGDRAVSKHCFACPMFLGQSSSLAMKSSDRECKYTMAKSTASAFPVNSQLLYEEFWSEELGPRILARKPKRNAATWWTTAFQIWLS